MDSTTATSKEGVLTAVIGTSRLEPPSRARLQTLPADKPRSHKYGDDAGVPTGARLTRGERELLERRCRAEGRSINDLVRLAVREYLGLPTDPEVDTRE